MLRRIEVTASDRTVTADLGLAVTEKPSETLEKTHIVTGVTDNILKDKNNENEEHRRESITHAKSESLKFEKVPVTPVIPLTPFLNDCMTGKTSVDLASYALKSFDPVDIDSAMQWISEHSQLGKKFPQMEKEKQNKVLFYVTVGLSLGFQ